MTTPKDTTPPNQAEFTGKSKMPDSAQDCGMEQAGEWGLLQEPIHGGAEPKRERPEVARPF